MRLIKLLLFLFILSSCNKYLGKIEQDYSPKNEISEVLSSNINKLEQKIDINFGYVKYPTNKFLSDNFHLGQLEKIISLDKDSIIYLNKDNIFYVKRGFLYKKNINDFKDETQYELDLDKDENIVIIIEYNKNIYALSDKSKLFILSQDSLILIEDFDILVGSEPLFINKSILIFDVFGEIFEIDINSNSIETKGKFIVNHGILTGSNTYTINGYRSYLFNSGTLIFLDHLDNQLKSNYYIEDLNILSSLNLFDDFLDAPYEFDEYLYFIDKKGLISVFNPTAPKILWEVDINTSIKDYIFSNNGYLTILTNNKILVLDREGNNIFDAFHMIENPKLFFIRLNEIYIFNDEGIAIFDIKTMEQKDIIKKKLKGHLQIIKSDSNIFLKDINSLYKISE